MLLIILSAVAIIFFAISLNWGRVSQIKNYTTIGATTTAALAGSSYASYGEMQQKTTLGGEWEHCAHNSIFGAILTLLLVVVICLVAWATCVSATQAGYAMLAAIALSSASLALQVAVVQPGLTRMWSQLQLDANLSTTEQFLTNALQNALQNSVTDSAVVTDYFDANTNGRYGFNIAKGLSEDVVSRYAFYSTEYMKNLRSKREDIDLSSFTTGLSAFLPKITNGVPAGDQRLTKDPRYNPCCQPVNDADGKPLRPNATTCPDRDPIPAACNGNIWNWPGPNPPTDHYGDTYPLAFERGRPDYLSSGSFLARFGIDEEVRNFTAAKSSETSGMFKMFWDMGDIQNTAIFSLNATPVAVDANNPKRLMDPVFALPTYLSPANQCADAAKPEDGINWKPGKEIYCQTTWKYDDCAKYKCAAADTGGDCCTAAAGLPVGQWPEDQLDDTIDQLKLFNNWARARILSQNPAVLNKTLETWYGEIMGGAYWMGPKCLNDGSNAASCANQGYKNGVDGGVLYTIKRRLDAWDARLRPWVFNNNFANDAYWCVPATVPNTSSVEYTTIMSGASNWGDLKSVVNCLNYYSDPNGAYTAFQECQTAIDTIKGDATKAGQFESCKTAYDAKYANAGKAQKYVDCNNAVTKIFANAGYATKYTACSAAITTACPGDSAMPAACADVALGALAPIVVVGNKPAYDGCSGLLFKNWVSGSITYFSNTTGINYNVANGTKAAYCAGPTPPGTVCTGDLPDTTGVPAYDICTGADYTNWLAGKVTALGGTWPVCGPGVATTLLNSIVACQALPASSIIPVADACANVAGYDQWLTDSQGTYNGGVSKATYCAGAGPTPPTPKCDQALTLPRSLYGNPPPRYDVCDNDATWNAVGGGADSGAYQKWLKDSMDGNAAFQQGQAGFRGRYQYLNSILQNATNAISNIEGFSGDIQAFLDGPVRSLVNIRQSLNATNVDSIPNSIIYGWKDEIPPKGKNRDGYWHVVRATVVIPSKLPSVGTRTSGFLGSTRCYFMQDYEGLVMVQIDRWDEDHDTSRFNNKTPIWKVNFRKPGTPDVLNPSGVCDGSPWNKIGISVKADTYSKLVSVWGSETSNLTKDILPGAFMINGQPLNGTPDKLCYNHVVIDLLPNGISTQVCARYNRDPRTTGMGVHFEKCP